MVFTPENVLIISYCIGIPCTLFVDYLMFKKDEHICLSGLCMLICSVLLAPMFTIGFLAFCVIDLVQTHGERILLAPLFKNPFYKRS